MLCIVLFCDWIKILWASIQKNHDRFLRGQSGDGSPGMEISEKQLLLSEKTKAVCPLAMKGENPVIYLDNLRQACLHNT